MEQPIFIVNGSKCVFWHTEVPFVGLIGFWKKLGPWGPKKSHNFRRTMPWALMEQPIFIVNGSKCVFRHTEVPFVGLIGFWKKLGLWGPKNPIIFAVQCPQHERSNRFSSLMAQNACFDIRKCPLGVWLTCEKIVVVGAQKPQNFRRTMPSARTEQPIFIVNGSKCVFRRTKVPFVGLVGIWKKLGPWGPKNPIIFAVQCPQHERSNRFSSLMAQNACFDIRTCPLGVWLTCEKNCGRGGPKTPKFSPYNALNTNEATDFHR